MPTTKKSKKSQKTKCAAAIWKKFTPIERELWTDFYTLFLWNENYHTEWTGKQYADHRHVTAHNMACEAVWVYQNMLFKALAKGFSR